MAEQTSTPMAPILYGPNTVLTNEEVEKRRDVLRNVSDDEIRKCEQWLLEEGKSLAVLVVGETGVGKSTFINGLFGKAISDVGSGPPAAPTKVVKCYTGRVGEVEISVVEVPELDIDEMRAHSHVIKNYFPTGVDLVFVCQKLNDRYRPCALKTLQRLSVVFGKEILDKAMMVLTFANNIPVSWHGSNFQDKFKKDWYDQATVIRARLQKELQISREEAEKFLLLPAGFYKKGHPRSSRQILDVTNDWIYDILFASANTCLSATPAVLRVIASHVKEDSSGGLCGYASEFVAGVTKCLAGSVFRETVYEMIENVISAIFSAVNIRESGTLVGATLGGTVTLVNGVSISILMCLYGIAADIVGSGVKSGGIAGVITAGVGAVVLGIVIGVGVGAVVGAFIGIILGRVVSGGAARNKL